MSEPNEVARPSAEQAFAEELEALAAADRAPRPPGWHLSPQAVATYVLGGKAGKTKVTAKYIGDRRLVEVAIATLATDRALLLVGEPGTAKSWLSEHLAAAISGDSRCLVQGTAGTTDEQMRYSWNYAMLLADGPSEKALVKSPVYRAMESGAIVRVEEVSRCPSEVQDALITILSEKVLAVPELGLQIAAERGFNLIATANTRDRGVNEMSSAMKRRFNIVTLPIPDDVETEVGIVRKRVAEIGVGLSLPAKPPAEDLVRRVVQIFHELRRGQTLDGSQKVRSPSGVLSTAEVIALFGGGMSLAGHFGNGVVGEAHVAPGLRSAVVQNDDRDVTAWTEYIDNVLKQRGGEWKALHRALKDLG